MVDLFETLQHKPALFRKILESNQSPQPIRSKRFGVIHLTAAVSPTIAGDGRMQRPAEKLDASLKNCRAWWSRPGGALRRRLSETARIDTLGYVTKLVENQEATIAGLRVIVPGEHGEDRQGTGEGGLCGGEKTAVSDQKTTSNHQDSSGRLDPQAENPRQATDEAGADGWPVERKRSWFPTRS